MRVLWSGTSDFDLSISLLRRRPSLGLTLALVAGLVPLESDLCYKKMYKWDKQLEVYVCYTKKLFYEEQCLKDIKSIYLKNKFAN